MRQKLGYLLISFICLWSTSQAQGSLAYMLRIDGHAVEADALMRLVSLELSPEWTKAFQGARNQEERKALARVIGAFLDSRLETEGGGLVRNLPTGLMLAAMDDAKGEASLQLQLKFSPNPLSRRQTLLGMEKLAVALEETKGSPKTKIAFDFDPEIKRLEQSALREHGSDVYLVLPTSGDWNQEFLKILLH